MDVRHVVVVLVVVQVVQGVVEVVEFDSILPRCERLEPLVVDCVRESRWVPEFGDCAELW